MDDETGEHREALGSLDQARGGEQVGHLDGGGHEGQVGAETRSCVQQIQGAGAADCGEWDEIRKGQGQH